jgi:hypothetical protein
MSSDLEPYRLWLEYLRVVPIDRWSEQVRADFEGCFAAPSIDQWIFEANYERGLFYDSGAVVPSVVETDQAGEYKAGQQIALTINITAADDDITSGVLAYVNLHREAVGWSKQKGRPPFTPEPAKYQLASRPDVEALSTTLAAYQLIKANESGAKPEALWELAITLQKTHDIGYRWKNASDGADKRSALSNIMSRYRVRAEQLLDGVARGVFPVARTEDEA